jgi:hypothetical protein
MADVVVAYVIHGGGGAAKRLNMLSGRRKEYSTFLPTELSSGASIFIYTFCGALSNAALHILYGGLIT